MFGNPRLQITPNVALPLLHLLVLLIVFSPGCLSAIQLSQPGNQANVATGTTNLMITATVTTSPSVCSWLGTGLTATDFYSSSFGGCDPSSTSTHNITCTNSAGVINTTLTYLTALTSNTNVSLSCDSAVVYSLSMIIKDCKPNMGSGVIATTNPTSSCGFGCTVQYSCASNHTGTDVNATCQEDATFDNDPVCIQITCANSDLPCSNNQYCFNQTGSTNAGTNVAIQCNTGYSGNVSAACGNDGNWTITPQSPCPALCSVSDITSSPGRCTTDTGDILEGQSITVTCCNGYEEASTMAMCTSDRSWSNLPTCTKADTTAMTTDAIIASNTSTPSTIRNDSNGDPEGKSLSDGAIAGIVIGCLIVVAIIIVVLIAIFCAEICCCTFSILCLSWGTKEPDPEPDITIPELKKNTQPDGPNGEGVEP